MDDKTREWSKRYFAKMNRMPTMWQAGVYSSVMYYLNAIKDSGTDDPLKVAAKMREKQLKSIAAALLAIFTAAADCAQHDPEPAPSELYTDIYR